MKPYLTALLIGIGVTLTSCAHHLPDTSPAFYNPNCYVNIYDHTGFRGEVVQLQGPATHSSLRRFKGRNWDNEIGSVQTGPGCWLVLYKHKDFKGSSKVIAPNTTASSLGNLSEEAESLQVLDHQP